MPGAAERHKPNAMLKEEYLQLLLQTVYENQATDVYDHTAQTFGVEHPDFLHTKEWADHLVHDKLAEYVDPQRSCMQITNFGRYWILNGGYGGFLRDGHTSKNHKENHTDKEREELIEARLKLTKYRLAGFWLTIFMSALGFLLSLYNLFMMMRKPG